MAAPFEFETIPFTGESDFESEMEEESEVRRGSARPVVRDHRRFGRPRIFRPAGRRVLARSRIFRPAWSSPRAQWIARRRARGWQHVPGYWRSRGPRWWLRRRHAGLYPAWRDQGTTASYEPFEPDSAPPPPSFGSSFAPSFGGDDEKVRWIQSRLNDLLGVNLPVTGMMDPATRSAVRTFQRQSGLPVDGIVGPPTEQALAQPPQAAAPDAEPSPAAPSPSEPAAPPGAPTTEMEFGFGRRFRRRRRPCRCNYGDQFEWGGD